MTSGPMMIDVVGLEMTDAERQRLRRPEVAGVILFARNYQSPSQLAALTTEIKQLCDPPLIIAVDQEGGRVQRFREGFQTLPAMSLLGDLFDKDEKKAVELTELFGWIMASELLQYDVDLSFAPVLDLSDSISSVIGDRAFHGKPDVVTKLANAWIRGMKKAGMEAVGKHFPGHGSVEGDSHHMMPFDKRSFTDIQAKDLIPFRRVIDTHLGAMMMAHVIYDQVDKNPAGYSKFWIEDVLREQLDFDGLVFSDDLSMAAAGVAGGYSERAALALEAGCDILLVCNDDKAADEVLDSLAGYHNLATSLRLTRLYAKPEFAKDTLFESPKWLAAIDQLEKFNGQALNSDSGDLFQ